MSKTSTPLPEQWAVKQHIEKNPKCEWLCTHTNLKNLGERKDEVPLPEQGGFDERLDEIVQFDIDQHDKDCGVTITRDWGNCDCNKTELKAAIRTLILEEIIGEDVELRDPDDHLPNAYMYLKGKSELRAEQRKKLEGTNGTK